jgi:S-adenosylmethionine decarboxylase proenzyme
MRNDFGKHLLVDFIDCDPTVIGTVAPAKEIVLRAMKECGATILTDLFHQFQPFGVSGIVLIAESHASFHSWPEDRFAALDIFTCGEMEPTIAVEIMKRGFAARKTVIKVLVRGQLEANV